MNIIVDIDEIAKEGQFFDHLLPRGWSTCMTEDLDLIVVSECQNSDLKLSLIYNTVCISEWFSKTKYLSCKNEGMYNDLISLISAHIGQWDAFTVSSEKEWLKKKADDAAKKKKAAEDRKRKEAEKKRKLKKAAEDRKRKEAEKKRKLCDENAEEYIVKEAYSSWFDKKYEESLYELSRWETRSGYDRVKWDRKAVYQTLNKLVDDYLED
jgi:hypothetical protein